MEGLTSNQKSLADEKKNTLKVIANIIGRFLLGSPAFFFSGVFFFEGEIIGGIIFLIFGLIIMGEKPNEDWPVYPP